MFHHLRRIPFDRAEMPPYLALDELKERKLCELIKIRGRLWT